MEKHNEINTAGTVGYLGPNGTHSEEAVCRLYPGNMRPLKSYSRIDMVFQAVASGEIAEAVVPIENSLEGSVNITLDTLARDVGLWIVGEVIWPVKHHLLVKPGTSEIRTIISHMQALAQCREYLGAHYSHVKQTAVESTAQAARLVAAAAATDGNAAIGSAIAARFYGLEVAAAEIQDSGHNATRFVVVRRQPAEFCPGEGKTSLAFQIDGARAGSLYKILNEFASRKINLTKIESRPARVGLGVYIFFIDVEGSLQDRPVREACEAVQRQALWFKNLGSYPVLFKP